MKHVFSRGLPGLMLALALGTTPQAAPALKAGVFEPAQPAPEFSLQGSDGAELKLARYRGKLVLLVFGFTNCPEVCPTTLATLAETRKALGADAAAVQVVYVTVDPERDDVTRIRQYLGAFDASFIGGTSSPDTLAAMRKRYGVAAEKVARPGGGYGMSHSSSVYLIDREGRLRAMMPYGHEAKDFVHDLKLLLASK
ncbi:SCO family protein [Ideonella sp.]|uniref:SCO family protein n=1 Tax=Ideonella sp. TaxID=1929293 RepID=UPI0035AE9C31